MSFCLTKTGRFNALLAWQWTGAGPRACRSCLSTHGSQRGPHRSVDRHLGCDAHPSCRSRAAARVGIAQLLLWGGGADSTFLLLGAPFSGFHAEPLLPFPPSTLTSFSNTADFTSCLSSIYPDPHPCPRIRFWHPSLLDGTQGAPWPQGAPCRPSERTTCLSPR